MNPISHYTCLPTCVRTSQDRYQLTAYAGIAVVPREDAMVGLINAEHLQEMTAYTGIDMGDIPVMIS